MRLTSPALAAAGALAWTIGGAMPASAQKAYFLTGENLVEACGSSDGVCLAYIMGVVDRIASEQTLPEATSIICVPTSVTAQKVKDLTLKYIRKNPDLRQWPASVLVWNALQKSFPCPSRKRRTPS